MKVHVRGKTYPNCGLVEGGQVTRSTIEAAGHRLVVGRVPPNIHLNEDPTRLTQVFVNLLNNAAKYTPYGGVIEISLLSGEDTVGVSIRDTGIGIPESMQAHIFELFTQLEPVAGKIAAGLGIGLTLVKRLVELHHGSVEVESRGDSKGSTFTVHLPRLPLTNHRPEARADAGAAPVSRRILIVDDNHDALRSLEVLLKHWGHDVRTADNGVAAIAIAVHHRPDVIFMDLGMPLLNGYEAAERIRATEWGQTVTLVAFSGWGQEADRQRARQAGFDHHLVKPGNVAEIQAVIAVGRHVTGEGQ